MRFVLVGAVLTLVVAAGAAGSGRPHVALVQASPVVVTGTGFAPGRPVAVGYAGAGTRVSRDAKPNAQGRFRLVLRGVAFDRCKGAWIKAGAASALVILPCSAPGGRPTVVGTIAGVVRGSAFVPGEHVALTARLGDAVPVTAKLETAQDGSFSTQLSLRRQACGDLFLRAVGSLGSNATFTVAAPDCKSP